MQHLLIIICHVLAGVHIPVRPFHCSWRNGWGPGMPPVDRWHLICRPPRI